MKTSAFVLQLFLLCTACIGFSKTASAHYIWIEAPFEWQTGKADTIRFFYGEYAEGRREEAGKRLEEVNGLIAWILTPRGEKKILQLQKRKDHFSAVYTPETAGSYEIVVSNTEREVVDWTQYDIGIVRPTHYAHQLFSAGGLLIPKISEPDLPLQILPAKWQNAYAINQPIHLKLLFQEKAVKGKLMIYAPNTWMKEIEEENGGYQFTPLEKGMYIIESIYKERVPGIFKGKSYEAIRHRTVVTLFVR